MYAAVHVDRAFIIDCHAHMTDDAFSADLETVLERAASAGVAAVVTVSETLPKEQG